MQNTGNAFDLALSGRGFFVLSNGDATVYTRGGQFGRDAENTKEVGPKIRILGDPIVKNVVTNLIFEIGQFQMMVQQVVDDRR